LTGGRQLRLARADVATGSSKVFPMKPIWTLNARDSVQLDVVSSMLGLTYAQMRWEIVEAHEALVRMLERKGIDYATLRSALTPQPTRKELAFVFDTTRIDSGWYGFEVAAKILPHLNRKGNHSILVGDLTMSNQDLAFDRLQRHLHPVAPCEIEHTSQLYAVYLNNLSKRMAESIHRGLLGYAAYAGYIPCTYSSRMKDWLSATLVPTYLKRKTQFICGHEEDRPNDENVNLPGWPIEDCGYEPISLQDSYVDLFLDYKIERAVYPGFESDTRFSLNAISDEPRSLAGFAVSIEEAKAEYLRRHKRGSLALAGIETFTAEQLQELVKEKITHNYIYYLRFLDEQAMGLFNVILEVSDPAGGQPTRLMAALEYQPQNDALRLVTLY
jgi:hypothetical protein